MIMISSKLVNYISIRNYSTVSKPKKILICGNDITGLSLGISSEIIESNNIYNNKKNDTGIVLTNNSYKIFESSGGEKAANEILNNSVQINGIGYFSKNGRPHGFLNFLSNFKNIEPSNSIVFASTESKIKEVLVNQCTKVNRGEGSVSFKRGLKIKKISENNNDQPQQQDNDNGVFITFSNSQLKIHYDMVVGSSNCYESQDPVREYLSDKLEKSDSLYGKESSSLRHFSTVINNASDLSPPIIATQFLIDKKLTSFILPNNKISLSGSFIKKQLQLQQQQQQQQDSNESNYKNLICNEYSSFEDLGAHNIVSLQDSQYEIPLGDVSNFKFNSFVHNSLCLIGDAADKLPQDNLFGTVIGIEDAHKLVEILTKDNNDGSNNIPKQLQEFNKDRVLRMDQYMKLFTRDQGSIFNYQFFLLLLGRFYYKMVYSSKNQLKRLKNIISK